MSPSMSRSRDTIFQSLGLEGLKSWSRSRLSTLKSPKMGVSRPYLKVRFKKLNKGSQISDSFALQ